MKAIYLSATKDTPVEWLESLKNRDPQELYEKIEALKPHKPTKKILTITIPAELSTALKRTKELGHKHAKILILAAEQYRQKHPIEENWQEHHPPENTPKGDREQLTIRLTPPEHELLQNIGRGSTKTKNRHHALLKIAKIIDQLQLHELTPPRRTVYLPIPDELEALITKKCKQSGLSKNQILHQALEQ